MADHEVLADQAPRRPDRRPPLTVERRGPALWLTLDRADVLNSLNHEMVAALDDVLEAIEAGAFADVACLVVTGAGRAFCAGGDLGGFEDGAGGFVTAAPLFGAISKCLTRLEACRLPVIAAVNGLAVAGGLEILLACDIVVAVEKAMIGDGHANYGLLPGAGGSVRLPRKVGANRAKYMMLTGRLFAADELARWGLVNEVVPEGDLENRVGALVDELAARSPLAAARMKRLVDDGLQQSLPAALESEFAICSEHDRSFDRNEGLAAFTAKRRPRFEGR